MKANCLFAGINLKCMSDFGLGTDYRYMYMTCTCTVRINDNMTFLTPSLVLVHICSCIKS